mgnify:CR=1 FL=1
MFDIAEDREDQGQGQAPTIKQLSVFLPNRVGALLSVTRCLDAYAIRVCALSIQDSADHAVLRLVVDRPGLAHEALVTEGYSVFEAELLGVQLAERGIRAVLSALLMAELNVHYVYPLIAREHESSVVAIHVEDVESAVRVLNEAEMPLIDQRYLE